MARRKKKNPGVPGWLGIAAAAGIGYLLWNAWKTQKTFAQKRSVSLAPLGIPVQYGRPVQ